MTNFDPYASYRSDETLEVNGIVLQEPNVTIRIRRAGGKNTKFKTTGERVMRPLRRALELGQVSDDVQRDATARILAEAVIIGWHSRDPENMDADREDWPQGVWDPDLKEIVEFNQANVIKALKAAPELAGYVMAQAADAKLFREEVEDDLKN